MTVGSQCLPSRPSPEIAAQQSAQARDVLGEACAQPRGDVRREGDVSDWTVSTLGGGSVADWRGIQTCSAHSGDRIFRFGGASCPEPARRGVSAFVQPMGATGIAVPAGSSRVRLSFWHRWDFQQFESGTLHTAVDGGSWIAVPKSAIRAGGTNEFTGYKGSFVNTVVDLDAMCDLATGGISGCAGRTVRIAFNAHTDVGDELGWFLDDVEVSACRSRGCTGAPAAGAAPAGDHQVQVSWANGAPPSSTFNVYRALGTCAAPGPFSAVARGVSGTGHLDQGLGGGLTYAYIVTGVNAQVACESEDSACVEATPAGGCSLPFTFDGLSQVSDSGGAACALALSWNAAHAPCAGPVTYNVYRSTVPGFTPAPENRIATGVTGTSFNDSGTLASGTTYFYVVRAVGGQSGAEDGNTVVRSAAPSGPYTEPGTLIETFEAPDDGFDHRGWTAEVLAGDADWKWSNVLSESPTRSWHSPTVSSGDRVLVSPSFGVQASTTLTFWHDYHFESSDGLCMDGGTLEISTNGGATWQVLPDSAFLEGGFNGTVQASDNPLRGKRGWCGERTGGMGRVTVRLSSWNGATARLRWHAAENASGFREGWYVDSVTLADAQIGGVCQTAPLELDFYTLPPCRLLDTRNPNGPRGGPALQPFSQRTFALAGACGVPATAKALSVNLAVVSPTAPGNLTVYPADRPLPTASSINFAAGLNRANNALLPLSVDGSGAVTVQVNAAGALHFIVDVNGYFE